MTFHFDWYQGSTPRPFGDFEGVLAAWAQGSGLFAQADGAGLHGYEYRREFLDDEGQRHVAAMWGGRNPGVNVRGSGPLAAPVADLLRGDGPHKVSRADVALDVSQEGVWGELTGVAMARAEKDGLASTLMYDPVRPQEGGTLYIGGRTSPLRWRIYQKGWEQVAKGCVDPDDVDPHWVRIEAQVRPLTRDKARFSGLEPVEMLGYARWSRLLAADLLKLDLRPIKRAEIDKGTFVRKASYAVQTFQRALMDFGYYRAMQAGNLAPTNAEAIAQVAEFVRSTLSGLHPQHRPYEPGWQVIQAVARANEVAGMKDAHRRADRALKDAQDDERRKKAHKDACDAYRASKVRP